MRLRFLVVLAIVFLKGGVVFSQNANFKALDSTQCSGTLFTLIALNGTYPSSSYAWEITNPSNVTTTYTGNDTIFVVLTSTGIYDVRLTVTNGTTATVLNLDFLQVFSKPTIGFTANGSASAITGCSPFLVNFNGAASSPGGGSTYSNVNFVFGDGNISNSGSFGTNPSFNHTYTNLSTSNLTYKPKVNILNSNGCFDTLTLPSITVKPSPTLSSPLNPNSICSGSTFNYIPTSTTAGCTFSWSRAANPSIVQGASSGTYPPFSETLTLTPPGSTNAAVTYVVTTTAPAPNSCSTQQNVVVTVKALPTVSISPSTLTICSGSSGTLTAAGSPAGGTYTWSNSLGSAATSTISAAGTYSVTYSNNGCVGTPSSAAVTVSIPPTVSAIVTETSGSTNNDGTICSGAVATITATPSSAGGTYSWSPVTSLFTNATCTTPYVAGTSVSIVYAKPSATITYSVTYTLGCASLPASSVITVVSGPTNSYNNTSQAISTCSAPADLTFSSTSTPPYGNTITNTTWSFPGGSPSSGSGTGPLSVNYTTGGQTYGITLTTTSSNGCSTSTIYTNAATIGNGTAPTSTFTVAPSTSICIDTSITLSYSGVGADSIRWDLGDGTILWRSDNISLSHTYANPGNYTVSMTPFTVVGNQLGCSGSASTQVITVNGPKAAFTTSTVNCSNQFTRTFTNTTLGTTASTTYSWSFQNGTTATANTFGPHTVNWGITTPGPGTYTVTLTASDPSTGCPSSSITSSVKINQNNAADFQSYIGATPTTSICLGGTVNFINTTPQPQLGSQSGNSTNTLWDWNTNNGVSFTSSILALRGTPKTRTFSSANGYSPGQYGIAMINVDNYGCRDTIIKSNYVTVHGIIPNLNIADTLCAGQSFIATDYSTAPMSSIASRTWSWGDGTTNTTGNNATPSHTYTNPGSYTITLTITDNSGLVPACSTVITKQVLVQKPTASFSVNRNYICNNQSVVVTNNSTGTGLTNWNWSATNATPATGTGSNFGTFTFNNQGNQTITLSVTDNKGCVDDTIIPISVFDVEAFATPSTTNFSCFAGTNGNPNIVTFTNLSAYNVDNTSAQWNFGNGQTSTVWEPSVTYNLPGTYNVSLTVSSLTGCQNTTNVGTITVGGLSATIDVVNANLTGCSCYNVSVNTSTSGTTSAILYFGTSGEAGVSIPSSSQTYSNSYCNTSSSPQTFTPYIFISNGSCSGSIFSSEIITVNPSPIIANISTQACSGSAFSVTPSSTAPNIIPTGTSYAWSAPTGTGFTGGAASSGSPISGTLTNSGTSPVTATYTVTATSGTAPNQCTSTFTVSVTVNPTVSFTAASTNPTVCNGSNGTITLSGLQNNTNYTYSLNGGTATAATSSGVGQISITGLSATTYSIIVNNPSTNCSSVSQSVSLTNPGAPDINDITDQVLCGGSYTLPSITGTNLTGSSPAYYTGSNGTGTALTVGAAISSTQTIFIYAATGGGCSDQETFTVTVNSLPTINGTLSACVGLTTQLTGSGTPNATTPWTSASPSIATVSSTGLVAGIAAGTSVITYKDINGCQITATVTVNSLPTFTTSSTNPTVCNGTNGTITLSSLQNNTNYTYTLNGGTATAATSNGSGQIVISNLASGSYVVGITLVSTGCQSATQTVTLTNPGAPDVNDITDQVLCGGSYTLPSITGTNLTGSSPAYYTGSNGTGTALTVGAAISSNQTIYIYAATPGGCSDQEMFTVTVNSLPTINGTLSVCVGLTTNLTGSGTPSAVNPWSSLNSTLATVSSTGIVTGVSSGNATIQYTDNNGCSTQTTLLINPANTLDIGNDITVCSTTNAISLSASISGLATTISWTGGSNNFSPMQGLNTNYTFGVTPSPYYLYAETVDPANTCPPAKDSLLITINPVPVVNAGLDQVICSNDTLSLNGTLGGSATSGTWTSNGNGAEEFLPTNTTLNGLFVPNQTGFIQITLTSNDPDGSGPCGAASDVFNVTIDSAPTVNAGADFVSCSNVPVQLNGIIGGGASSLTWTGNGTFNNASLANAQYTPTSTELSAGTAILTLSTDDPAGPCNLVTDQVVVTFTLPATANAGADQTICQGSSVTLNGGFGGSATSAIWSTALGTPAGTFSNVNTMTSTWTPPSNFSGTAKLVLTTNYPAGPCGAITDTVNIIVTPLPSIILPVTSVCSGQSLNVILPNTPNYSYNWIATNNSNTTGESLTSQNSSLINDVIQNNSNPLSDQIVTYNLIITDNITTCINSNFTFSVNVYPTPIANTVNNQVVCFGSNTSVVSLTGGPNGTQFNWINLDQPLIPSLISGFNSIPSSSVVPGTTADTAHIQITPSYNGCNGSPIIHNIVVLPQLAVTSIANDTLCSGELYNGVIFTGNAPGMSFTWSHTNTSLADNPIDFPGGPNAGNINPFITEPNITVLTAPYIDSSTITVTPSFAGCTNGIAAMFKLFVKLTPNAVVNPASQTVCAGQSTQLVDFTGNLDGVPGLVYNWYHFNTSIGIGTLGFNDIPPFTGTNNTNIAQTSNFNVYPSYNGCVGDTTSFSITVSPRPVINPTPDQNICGNTAISAVNFASSNGINGTTFCWTNTQPIIGLAAANCGNILSVVTPDSILPIIDAEIVVTPTFNGCDGITDTFHIIVHPVPTVNPTADQGGCAGTSTSAVTFSGSHANSVYDWTNTNGLAIGLSGPGMNTVPSFILAGISNTTVTSTFTVTPSLTTTYNGTTLTCGGNPDLFTIQAVDPIPDVYPIPDTALCSGETFHEHVFGGTITNPNVTYLWENDETASGLVSNGANTIPTQILTNNSLADIVSLITVTPTDGYCSGQSTTFSITVKPLPDLFLSQSYDSLCAGNQTDLINFSSSLTGTTYSWIGTTNVGYSPNNGTGSSIASVIGVNSGNTPLTDSIFVSSFNNGCAGDIDTLTITVNPTAIVSTSFPSYAFCSGETINIPFNGSVVGATYSWTNNNTNTGIGFTGNGGALSLTVSNTSLVNQISTITVTPTFNGCPGQTYSFTVIVKPLPNIFPAVLDIALCANTNTPLIDFLGDYDDSTNFDWINSNISIGANGSLPTAGTGDILSFLTENTSGVTQVDSVIVTPELNGCFGASDTFLITVYPVTQVVTSDISVCSGTTIPTTCFTGSTPGVIYNWSSNNIGIGMDGSGVDCIPSFTAQAGTTVQTATITVTPVFNGCPGLDGTMQIEVRPVPIINPNPDLTFCDNQFADSVLFSSNITSTYLWTNNNISIGLGANGDGNLDSYVASNEFLVQQIDLNAQIVVTPTAFGCEGLNDTFNILVHPLPIVQANPDTTLCINQCFVPLATGTASFYLWDNGANQGLPYCPSQTIQLTVTGTDTNLCQNSDVMIVTYLQENPPVVNAGVDDSLCFGESYSLCAIADVPNVIFLWDNGVVDCTPFIPEETNTYIVAGYSINGCVERDTVTLVVHPLPEVTITTGDSILCFGETAILTGNGAVTYQWLDGPATQVYTFVPEITDDYTVVGYDQYGCTDTADITVVVNPLPIPLFSTDMTYGGCLPFCPTLTDQTGANGNGPVSSSVVWEFSNGTISTEMGTTNPCFDDYGCYDVTLISTTAEGCKDTLVQQDYLCVNQIIASFTPDVTEQLISDPCFEFTNNSVNATSFQWFFGDGEESDFVSTNHCFDSIGCYPVTLVAYTQDGCTDSVVQVVCVKDQLIIYVPNAFTPDGDGRNEVFLPILTAGFKPGSYELNIYNRWGERIFNTQDENEGWDGTYLGNQVQIGTYTYTIKLKGSENNKVYTFDGRVSLIR